MKNKKYLVYFILILSVAILIKNTGFYYNKYSNNVVNVRTGDVNMDGLINSQDYIMVRKFIMRTITFNNAQLKLADMNNDNSVTSQDYILIRKAIMSGDVYPATPTPSPVTPATPSPTPTLAPPLPPATPTATPVGTETPRPTPPQPASPTPIRTPGPPLPPAPTPTPTVRPATPRPATPTPRPTARPITPTPKATVKPTAKPATPKPTSTPVPTAKPSSYKITHDNSIASKLSRYVVRESKTTNTLEYKTYNVNGNKAYNYTLIWVQDAYKQVNSGLPKSGYGTCDQGYAILEYNAPGKSLVGVNASFFWDKIPEARVYMSKGVQHGKSNLHRTAYNIIGIARDGTMKNYGLSDQTSAQIKAKLEADGVRNTVAGNYFSTTGYDRQNESSENLTLICQVDQNNFVLFSGLAQRKNTLYEMWNTFGCRAAANLDGGGSARLYHRKNGSVTGIWVNTADRDRSVADMLYFVEQ